MGYDEQVWYCNTFDDGVIRIYDLKHTQPVRTDKKETYICEMDPSQGTELQTKVYFAPDNAIYVGRYD